MTSKIKHYRKPIGLLLLVKVTPRTEVGTDGMNKGTRKDPMRLIAVRLAACSAPAHRESGGAEVVSQFAASAVGRLPCMRLLVGYLFIAAVTLSASACTNEQRGPDYNGFTEVRYYRNSTDDVVTLKFPNGYVDYEVLGGLPRRDVESQMFFTAETRTLEPRTQNNNQSFEFPASLTQKIKFNIASWYTAPPGERNERMQRVLGSRFEMLMHPCIRNAKSTERFGLERYVIDPTSCPKIAPTLRDDILVERDSQGKLKTVIKCMPDDVSDAGEHVREGRVDRYSPHCEQTYRLEVLNAQVTIFYPREFNKDWKGLQQRVSALLVSFAHTNK
jgi:hypothetical protein